MSQDPMAARLAMLRRVGGNKLIGDLIDLLFEGAPRKLEAARAALAAGDAGQVALLAHGLASSAGNLGATDMQQAALAVEHCADGGTGDLGELLRRLEASWGPARDMLAETKRGLSA
jgi:HPt (histidine-containing phosphotransfer) domain-containing protein